MSFAQKAQDLQDQLGRGMVGTTSSRDELATCSSSTHAGRTRIADANWFSFGDGTLEAPNMLRWRSLTHVVEQAL